MKRIIVNTLRRIAERFPRLLMAYRLSKSHWQLLEDPIETPMGFRLIGNRAMERGEFEIEETRLIRTLLHDSDLCINVGANIGYYCCVAANVGKRVIAFEPVALNLQYVVKNVEANGWGDIVDILPLALSDRPGVAKMYGGGTGASLIKGWAKTPEGYPTLVATSTLDAEVGGMVAGKRCLVIVDIEGAEKRMLDGARGILSMSPKPMWMVEVSIGEHQPRGVSINPDLSKTFQLFWENGYEAWTTSRPYRQIVCNEIDDVVACGKDSFKSHNFLFVENDKEGCWRVQR